MPLRCRKRGRRVLPAALRLDPVMRDPLAGITVWTRSDRIAVRSGGGSAPPQPRHCPRRAPLWRAGAAPATGGRHSLSHGAAFRTWSAPTGRQGMMTSPSGQPIAAIQSPPGPHTMPANGVAMWRSPLMDLSVRGAAGWGKVAHNRPETGRTVRGQLLQAHFGHLVDPSCSPEPRGGPHPANLSCRRPARTPSGGTFEDQPADRSSGLHDKAHADRCQPRGRDPRGGAGR